MQHAVGDIEAKRILKELRDKSDDELHATIADSRKALFDWRLEDFRKKQPEKELKYASKYSIAAAKTILREREIAAEVKALEENPPEEWKPEPDPDTGIMPPWWATGPVVKGPWWSEKEAERLSKNYYMKPGKKHSKGSAHETVHVPWKQRFGGRKSVGFIEDPPSDQVLKLPLGRAGNGNYRPKGKYSKDKQVISRIK